MSYIEMENIYKLYGDKILAINDFNLDIKKNEFIALIGPSGCGKSTLLRMIAGLEEISYGELKMDGRVVNNVHAKDRDIAMVFQNYALYPHLSIYDNIAFGLKLRKASKETISEQVERVSETLGLTDHLDKKPNELSGGQRQRVALGRAMVQGSNIFLMDEPLSNLDAKLRGKMRVEILKLHKKLGVTTIYVTHDQVEAMTMADRIVVLDKGVVQQIGTPLELYHNPENLFVATFIGDPEINILEAQVNNGKIQIGEAEINVPEEIKDITKYEGQQILLGLRPESFVTDSSYISFHDKETIQSEVELAEMRGDHFIIATTIDGQDISLKVTETKEYNLGDTIRFAVDYSKMILFDPATEQRIR